MKMDSKTTAILERCLGGTAASRDDCLHLLSFPETSLEASAMRAVADHATRGRFANRPMLLAQIGIENFPCPANCGFCAFGEKHSALPPHLMQDEEIVARAEAMTRDRDVFALFLMLMHTFDMERLLRTVEAVHTAVAGKARLVVNIGDFDLRQARELKAAGVSGAYHVLRLGEGKDTNLAPEDRKRTIATIKKAELDWYYCCEPLGPEHDHGEIVDQIMLGLEYGCFQHAAMRRVNVPGGPLAGKGEISELRLAQHVAVVALAMLENTGMRSIAVHEPNAVGLVSGANSVYAESGVNPRDDAAETADGRGNDVATCLKMFREAGFAEPWRAEE